MGIQGMTNWKFTMFLAITLMLVAGLFSSTAMAAANDGHGMMTVAASVGDNFQATTGTLGEADYRPQILFANEAGYTLTFTYTANANMLDGKVEITNLNRDDWKIPFTSATDGSADNITATQAGGTTVPLYVKGSYHTSSTDDNELIEVTKSGDNVTKITVTLKGDGWKDAADTAQSVTITITGVTSAIPRSLYVPDAGYPYREYTFTTRSMAKGGSFRPLRIPPDDPATTDVDESDVDPQPKLNVGNVKSGKGSVKISPIVYQGETDRTIQLVFTAAGPMYDTDDIDSQIQITIPAGLGTKPGDFETGDTFPAPMPQIDTAGGDEFISVSRVTGTVQFANPNQRILADPTAATATIDITRMEYNAKIYVSYRKVDVNPDLSAAANFDVASLSGVSTDTIGATPATDVALDPDGTAGKEHVRLISGSGEIKIVPDIVARGSTTSNLVFTYTAHTALTDATLVITQPDDTDPAWSALTLVTGSANAREDNYVTHSGGGNATLAVDNAATPGTITLTGLDLAKSGSASMVTVRINRAMLAPGDPPVSIAAGAYGWGTTLNTGTVPEPTLYIVNVNDDVDFHVLNEAGDAIDTTPHYHAAEERNIRFRFVLSTPIKGGSLRFMIPRGWRQPSDTDVAGKARVKLLGPDNTNVPDDADNDPDLVDKYGADDNVTFTTSGNQITVNIKTLAGTSTNPINVDIQYGNGDGDMRGMVQRNAQADLEIIGQFSTGVSTRYYDADAPVLMRIGNVEAGSGTAMITSPASHTVEAGSDDNTIRIQFKAAGTMNNGSVRLSTPLEWGNLQETDAAAKNYIKVGASRSMVDQNEIRYGDHNVLVPLMTVGYGNIIEFVLSNVKAQPKIGIATFTVESAGGPSDTLALLTGETRPADAEDADKKEKDPYLLLGRVYADYDGDVTAGLLRLGVVAGEGGTGEAELVEIVRTDSGLQDYLNEDGEVMLDRQVHAGDDEIYLVFKYTPVETIDDGALRFTVPSDWSKPQEASSNQLGYTEIEEGSASLEAADFENQTVTIPIGFIDSSDGIEIHYGVGSLGAKAPTAKKTSKFLFAVKGTSGNFTSIGAVDVEVRSQASGRGSVSVDTGMMADDDTPTVYAGDDEGMITITYDPIGEIEDGRIKLTVPEALVGEDGVMRSHITPSSGSARYGGEENLDLDANADIGDKFSLIVSGVNLDHDDEFTFTYTATMEMTMPKAKGDLSFTVAVDGGEGPGEVAEGMPAPMQVGDPVTVSVIDAKAGSGAVDIAAMGSEANMGRVVASSDGNTVTVTYTAIGEIGEDKKITVTVPTGWSPPLNEAAADEKMGTFTVKHLLNLAADDADGVRNEGSAVDPSTMKADGAAADAAPMIMVAMVKAGEKLAEGDSVVFTYSNATATSVLGHSDFTTEYDGEGVEGNVTVLVESAEGATALQLEVDDFTIEDGPVTVTAKLLDANGEPATRSTPTVVTLNASSGTIASITIPAGKYSMTGEYSATEAARVTIEASATGLTGDEATFLADTNNPTINADSITADPMNAKEETVVKVSATGTKARAANTVLFSIGTADGTVKPVTDMAMTEDATQPGMYSSDYPIAAGTPNGTFNITVRIDGTNVSETATDALTIDTVLPVISDASRGDDTHVRAADIVTISATLSEAADVSADVSMLNATAGVNSDGMIDLMDADGDGPGMVYSGEVEVTVADPANDGEVTITITASDAAGNPAEAAEVMVTLDNTDPEITGQEIDMKRVMVGGMATISATLSEAATVKADVSMLNATAGVNSDGMIDLMDADGDGDGMLYSGEVTVTEEGDAEDITIEITATDDAGNAGTASVPMVTLDNTVPVISDASRGDASHVRATDMVTISATLSEAADVSADVSMLNATAGVNSDGMIDLMDADGDGDGMLYSGEVTVTAADPADDGEVTITITASDDAGNPAEAAMVMVTLDNTVPVISDASRGDASHVRATDMVTISAMLSEAADVSADVSMLNATAGVNSDGMIDLMDADGEGPGMVYSGEVEVTVADPANDGEVTITITASDDAGNEAEAATIMVMLDNTDPEITGESIDMSSVMAGDEVTISAMVSEAADVSADVSMLNATAGVNSDGMVDLMDADGSGMYSGTVEVTADGDAADIAIAITATDAAGNMGTASVMVTLDNTVPTVEASADMTHAKNGDTVTLTAIVSEAANVSATVSQLDDTQLVVELMDEDGDLTYTGPVIISMSNTAEDGSKEITVTATDAAGNSGTASASVMLDNTVPEVTDVSGSPSPARNGHPVTISATVSEASTVSADVSDLDTMQTEMVMLTDDDGDGTYTGSFTISDDNEAENGSRTVTVTATDAAGNSGSDTGTVDLINTLDYTSVLPAGISLFHVPLDVTAIDGEEATLSMVSDLYKALGDDSVNYLISYDGTRWNSYLGGTSGDAAITADLGIVAVMKAEKTITFTGNAWGEDVGPGAGEGASMITLTSGVNLVGVPVNDARISTVSSIMDLPEFAGKITSIITTTDDGKFVAVAAGGAGDADVRGDAAYIVSASEDVSQSVMGEGWSNGETASAAPIALFGHTVDTQTPALFVEGSIIDELSGLAKAGFRIKVKNLSTKAALSTISQSDLAQSYNMTFVDTNAGNAARIGDVLEISADSPDPLIGVKPVRHIVTVDDVKNSRIELEDLIAYEIPAETALLNNYPNPFNPETWIPYHLSEDADVKLTIYDISGEVVRDIDVGHQTAAKYDTRSKAIYWDGRNRFGEQVASGIYFYHLQAGDFSGTRKMVILK